MSKFRFSYPLFTAALSPSGTRLPRPLQMIMNRRSLTLVPMTKTFGSSGHRMEESSVRFPGYSFGSARIDGATYDHDLIIDRGKTRKRKNGASRKFRGAYGHTPPSATEDLP
jgi:hypothetical protein